MMGIPKKHNQEYLAGSLVCFSRHIHTQNMAMLIKHTEQRSVWLWKGKEFCAKQNKTTLASIVFFIRLTENPKRHVRRGRIKPSKRLQRPDILGSSQPQHSAPPLLPSQCYVVLKTQMFTFPEAELQRKSPLPGGRATGLWCPKLFTTTQHNVTHHDEAQGIRLCFHLWCHGIDETLMWDPLREQGHLWSILEESCNTLLCSSSWPVSSTSILMERNWQM